MFPTTASLRRNLRLKKDRHASPVEPKTPDINQTDFLIYEEVTQYLPRPGDRPRLIVLIGTFNPGFGDSEVAIIWLCQTIICGVCHCDYPSTASHLIICLQVLRELGSVSLNRRWLQKILEVMGWLYPVSVCMCVYTVFHLSVASVVIVDLKWFWLTVDLPLEIKPLFYAELHQHHSLFSLTDYCQ